MLASIFPALSPAEFPVSSVILPEEPELVVPEENFTIPLIPVVPASTLDITIAPELVSELLPDSIST